MDLLSYHGIFLGKGWSPWYHFKDQEDEKPHFIQRDDYVEMTGIGVTHKQNTTIPGGEYVARWLCFICDNCR
jgi:hypothetical protein